MQPATVLPHPAAAVRPPTGARPAARVVALRTATSPLPAEAGSPGPDHGTPAAQNAAQNVVEAQVAAVYRLAVDRDGLDGGVAGFALAAQLLDLTVGDLADAVDRLLADRLLRQDPARAGRLVAVDPEIAAATLCSPMERELARRQEQITRIKARTERYRADYARCRSAAGGSRSAVRHVSGEAEIRGALDLAAARCERRLVLLVAGRQGEGQLAELEALCLPLLDRGVDVRLVCQHRSRAELTIRTRLRRLCDAGALIRTRSHLPRSAAVFDDEAAVLFGPAGDDADAAGHAALVRGEPAVVGFLLDLFDDTWASAADFDGDETGYAGAADDLRDSIVELMAQGLTDEVVARKLGMSVRSCRRHIAALMSELGAVSRFQAGLHAARRRRGTAG